MVLISVHYFYSCIYHLHYYRYFFNILFPFHFICCLLLFHIFFFFIAKTGRIPAALFSYQPYFSYYLGLSLLLNF